MIQTDDWAEIERSFPYVAAMRDCVQDPIHHAEGDVWTHTKMVMAALGQFGCADDRVLRLTALYHDVAKPETRTVEYDAEQKRQVVRHPHHAGIGAATAWYDLWMAGEDLPTRLAVYWLCKWHQRVFHIWHSNDMVRDALSFASVASWKKLIDFARSDNAGRICANPQETIDNLDLLEQWLAEGIGDQPIDHRFFATDHDRIFYLEKTGRSPLFSSQETIGSQVIILSGLPGVGKDTHTKLKLDGLPVISLDTLREQFGIDATDNQGRIVQAAFGQARVFLRDRRPFVWNAQSVTKRQRDKVIRLCRDYDAHVTIHAFDRPLDTILRQNQQRERHVPVPVILAAARKWEPPSILEAHQVEWV